MSEAPGIASSGNPIHQQMPSTNSLLLLLLTVFCIGCRPALADNPNEGKEPPVGYVVTIDRKNNMPLSNLFVRMLQQMDIEMDKFGSSTGMISEV